MKKIFLLLTLLLFCNFTFGETRKKLKNSIATKTGPGPTFWKYILLPVTSFLPIWGAYDEGSHTNNNTPLLNFDRGMDVNAERQRLIDRIEKLTFK